MGYNNKNYNYTHFAKDTKRLTKDTKGLTYHNFIVIIYLLLIIIINKYKFINTFFIKVLYFFNTFICHVYYYVLCI